MNFEAEKKDMLTVLKEVNKVIDPRSVIDANRSMYVEACEDGWVNVEGSDGVMGIRSRFKAKVKAAGKTLIKGDAFVATVELARGDVILFDMDKKSTRVNISVVGGASNFKMSVLPTDRFVGAAYDNKTYSEVSIDSKLLAQIIDNTLFLANSKAIRGFEQGVNFMCKDNNLYARSVYTNGIAMSSTYCGLNNDNSPEFTIALLKDVIGIVRSVLPADAEVPVHIKVGDKNVLFQCGDTEIVARLINATFPDIAPFLTIDEDSDGVVVDKDNLFMSIKSIMGFTSKDKIAVGDTKVNGAGRLAMRVNDGKMSLRSETDLLLADDVVDVESLGNNNLDVLINGDLFIKLLACMPEGDMWIRRGCGVNKTQFIQLVSKKSGESLIGVLALIAD